ncbi:hypothetical protein ACFWWM_42190 [Streptomyces sp. NPDC058682]|uniref:hypothetical protein n=1 Tax=Streptomyces sp. NPDC058682 TaxID=3346596 RepID=UPI00365823DE
MEDRDEQQHLHALVELLEHGRQFEDLTTADPSAGPWKPAAGSDLEDEDVAVAPYHLSHAAWLALTVAGDHLRALRTSVLTEESTDRVTATLHTHAQVSLARGVIENAARAVWLLASDDRLIRIQRRLALQKKDIGSSTKLHDLLGGETPRTKEAREEVRLCRRAMPSMAWWTPTPLRRQSRRITSAYRSEGASTPLDRLSAYSGERSTKYGDLRTSARSGQISP